MNVVNHHVLVNAALVSGVGIAPSLKVKFPLRLLSVSCILSSSFLCFCVVARHVYGYTKVFDGDGDPYRPDQYVGVQNV